MKGAIKCTRQKATRKSAAALIASEQKHLRPSKRMPSETIVKMDFLIILEVNISIVDFFNLLMLERPILPSKLAVFNDQVIQSCRYTNDGRHYHPLNLVRIRILGNLLGCLQS